MHRVVQLSQSAFLHLRCASCRCRPPPMNRMSPGPSGGGGADAVLRLMPPWPPAMEKPPCHHASLLKVKCLYSTSGTKKNPPRTHITRRHNRSVCGWLPPPACVDMISTRGSAYECHSANLPHLGSDQEAVAELATSMLADAMAPRHHRRQRCRSRSRSADANRLA